MIKWIAVSGYFDPLHTGHLNYFKAAKKLGHRLVVIVNNDKQAKLKKGTAFMKQEERLEIVKALKVVDAAIISLDSDRTVRKTLAYLQPYIFAKGGDSTPDNVPEKDVCDKLGTKIVYSVGGGKSQSSSWILKKYLTKNGA